MRIPSLLLIVMLLVTGCAAPPAEDLNARVLEQAGLIDQLRSENKVLTEQLNAQVPQPVSLLSTAQSVMQLLKDQDMAGLTSYVHPVQGVRFTAYAHIDLQNDLLFTGQQVAGLMQDSTVYTWGAYDGSGEPIQLTFAAYYGKFIYDQDYINPHVIGNNTLVGSGNMINNLGQAYPAASFVEFHFNGFDPQYGGMDWTSLRLIFENVGGVWKLIGIQHDGWTI